MTAATCWLPSDEPDATKTRLLGPPHRARGGGAAKAGRRPGGVTLRGDPRFHHRDRRRSGPGAGAGDASLARDAGQREASARAFRRRPPSRRGGRAAGRRPHGAGPGSWDAAGPKGWWRRLSDGMRRTSSSIGESVTGLLTKRKLDSSTLEELEDVLVRA